MVVLLIGIGILGVAGVAISRSLAKKDMHMEVRHLNELVSAAQALRSTEGYPDNMIVLLRATKRLPPAFADLGGNALIHAWGGELTLTRASSGGFQAVLESVPEKACAGLARAFANSAAVSVSVNGVPGAGVGASDLCGSSGNTLALIHFN